MLTLVRGKKGAGPIISKYSRLACGERAKAERSLGGRSSTALVLEGQGWVGVGCSLFDIKDVEGLAWEETLLR